MQSRNKNSTGLQDEWYLSVMPLIQIVIMLCVVGLILWAIQQIPMDAAIAKIIRVVIIVAVCLWLLSLLAGWGGVGSFTWPRTIR